MFVVSELQDSVEIRAASQNKQMAVLDELRAKYTHKFFDKLGTCIFIKDIVEISDFELHSSFLIANTTFEAIFYRFYYGEVVVGKIRSQEEEKIVVEDDMGIVYEVHAANLFESCEFDGENENPRWVWVYKNNQLPFITGNTVRMRIKQLRESEKVVDASMNEQGLGPIGWWD